MPRWVEARAERIMKSTKDEYGPEKGKQIAYALATQQAHATGKVKKWHGQPFGTPEGRRWAKAKYPEPDKMQKVAKDARKDISPKDLEALREYYGVRGKDILHRTLGSVGLSGLGSGVLTGLITRDPGTALAGALAGGTLGGVYGLAEGAYDKVKTERALKKGKTPDFSASAIREALIPALVAGGAVGGGVTLAGADRDTALKSALISGGVTGALGLARYLAMRREEKESRQGTVDKAAQLMRKTGNLDQWRKETAEGRSLPHGTGEQPSPRPTRAQPIPVGMPGGGEAYFSPRQVGWLMSQGAFKGKAGLEPGEPKSSVWPRVGKAVLGGALGGIGGEVLARAADIQSPMREILRYGGAGAGVLASQLGEEKQAALAEAYLNRTLRHIHFLSKEAQEEMAKRASLRAFLGLGAKTVAPVVTKAVPRTVAPAVTEVFARAEVPAVRQLAGREGLRWPFGGRVTGDAARQHLVVNAPGHLTFGRNIKGGIRLPGEPPPLPLRTPAVATPAPAASGIPESRLRTIPGIQRPSMSAIPEERLALLPEAQRRLAESARMSTQVVPAPPPVPGASDVFHMRQGLGGYALGPSDISRATTLGSTMIPGEALHPQLAAQLLQGGGIRLPVLPRPDPAGLQRWMSRFRG